jgi:hypothetical protein
MKPGEWKTYRTRFLVKAKQLSSRLTFIDALGRQHSGRKGDYLVESFDGVISIAPRQIFEDIYVSMSRLGELASGEAMMGETTIAEIKLAEPTTGASTIGASMMGKDTIDQTAIDAPIIRQKPIKEPALDLLKFEALEIEQVKLRKSPGRERLYQKRAVQNDTDKEIVRHNTLQPDEAVRGRRKLPQPCRDRRGSTKNLRLM